MDLLNIIILFINFEFITSFGFNGFTDYEILMKKVLATRNRNIKYVTRWFEQPLDHLDDSETRTWKMRYIENNSTWKKGGPIVFVLGGESKADALTSGLPFELATETNAVIINTEHRFYGESMPFDNLTTANLKYLDSTQAIHDNANLLKYLKADPQFRHSKVIVYGGSYAGNLAAWMKLLYPNLIDAAIASSAPVLAKTDFFEYYEVVGEDLKKYGTPKCFENVMKQFLEIEELLLSESGIESLKIKYYLCNNTDLKRKENQMLFISSLMGNFAQMAQYGDPKRVESMCNDYELAVQVSDFSLWKGSCFDINFDADIIHINKMYSMKAWLYQTCNEFGYFQTGNSKKQPFTEIVSLDLYIAFCKRLYGEEFDKERVDKGVQHSNKKYGGLTPKVKNVVFLNGDMDPWSSLSIKQNLSNDIVAKVFQGASHCSDFFNPETNEARQIYEEVKQIVKTWLKL